MSSINPPRRTADILNRNKRIAACYRVVGLLSIVTAILGWTSYRSWCDFKRNEMMPLQDTLKNERGKNIQLNAVVETQNKLLKLQDSLLKVITASPKDTLALPPQTTVPASHQASEADEDASEIVTYKPAAAQKRKKVRK